MAIEKDDPYDWHTIDRKKRWDEFAQGVRKSFWVFVFFLLPAVIVLMLAPTAPEDPPIKRHATNETVLPVPGRHLVKMDYQIHLDSTYTGAGTYIPYAGREVQEVSFPRQVATTGLPINRNYPPASTEILFKRFNGEECMLLIPVAGVVDQNLNRKVPSAEYGAVQCPSKPGLFYLRVRVKGADGKFTIFAAPSREDLDRMVST